MIASVNTPLIDNELLKNIEKSFDVDVLKRIINEISIAAWDNRMESLHLDRWLKNFDGRILNNEKAEKIIALWLLMNFTFYTEKEVRALCRCIFDDFLHVVLTYYETKDFMSKSSIKEKIKHILETTLFLPLGNASESGTNILYYFRQETGLSRKSFEYKTGVEYKNLVYIDDVIISGSQVNMYIKEKELCAENKFVLTFIATDDAVVCLKKNQPEYELISSIMLDERSKCFSTNSFVFSGINSEALRDFAHQMCLGYGRIIDSINPLGYKDGQYLFGFYYNTPDNTLPVIWFKGENWIPAFPRYNKKYGESEVNLDESKYY